MKARWWLGSITFAIVGGVSVGIAFLQVGQIPADGDAQREALAALLGSVGVTLVTAGAILIAVLVPIHLERRRAQQFRDAEQQLNLLQDALRWNRDVLTALGNIAARLEEAANSADDGRRADSLETARRVAQSFYERGEQLDDLERLMRLISDQKAIELLQACDGALRRWNEQVAGDHTSDQVHLNVQDLGAILGTFGLLSENADKLKLVHDARFEEFHSKAI